MRDYERFPWGLIALCILIFGGIAALFVVPIYFAVLRDDTRRNHERRLDQIGEQQEAAYCKRNGYQRPFWANGLFYCGNETGALTSPLLPPKCHSNSEFRRCEPSDAHAACEEFLTEE